MKQASEHAPITRARRGLRLARWGLVAGLLLAGPAAQADDTPDLAAEPMRKTDAAARLRSSVAGASTLARKRLSSMRTTSWLSIKSLSPQ